MSIIVIERQMKDVSFDYDTSITLGVNDFLNKSDFTCFPPNLLAMCKILSIIYNRSIHANSYSIMSRS